MIPRYGQTLFLLLSLSVVAALIFGSWAGSSRIDAAGDPIGLDCCGWFSTEPECFPMNASNSTQVLTCETTFDGYVFDNATCGGAGVCIEETEICANGVQGLLRGCEARDLSKEECDERIGEFLDVCGAEPPAPTCAERCAGAAKQFSAACVNRGGDEGECAERANSLFQSCLNGCARSQN
jgi:hypothetical protein